MAARKLFALMVLSCTTILAGCLSMTECHTRYDVGTDLSTRVRIDVPGIRSDAPSEEKQKIEMKDFYDKLYLETAQDLATKCGISGKPKVIFTNKTETRCDVTLEGTSYHLLQALVLLVQGSNFEIKQKGKELSVKFGIGEESVDSKDMESTFAIKYDGKIISHNAHSYDKEENVIKWNTTKLGKAGVQFVLESNN